MLKFSSITLNMQPHLREPLFGPGVARSPVQAACTTLVGTASVISITEGSTVQ